VRELGRVLEVGDRELQFLRQVRHLADDLAERVLHAPRERLELGLRPVLDDIRAGVDARHHVRLGRDEVGQLDPVASLDEDPQAAVRHLQHPCDEARHARAVDLVRSRVVRLGVPARDHREHAVAGEDVVDELHRPLLADRERGQCVREGNAVPQR
jgi:hypothetical protein